MKVRVRGYLPLHIFIHSLLQLCVRRILAFSSFRCLIVCGCVCNKFFSAITLEMCTDNWFDDVVAVRVFFFFFEFLIQFVNLSSMLLLLLVSLSLVSNHVKLFDGNNILISIGPIVSIIR